MRIDDFEKLIDPIILERGVDYYDQGAVIHIEKIAKNDWEAIVEGSEKYHVEITLDENEIIRSYCDCPYDMGKYCKHQVAVFFELRDYIWENGTVIDNQDIKQNHKMSKSESLEQILENTDKDQLIRFIKEFALKDEKMYASLMGCFAIRHGSIDKTIYYKIIESHLNAAKDRYGFISYSQVHQAVEGSFQLLQNANEAMEMENYAEAIAMAQCVVELMIPALQECDDSSGYFGDAINQGFEVLIACSHLNLNDDLRKDFFNYCLNEWNKEKYHDWTDWQLDFLQIAGNLSKEKIEVNRVIQVIDDKNNQNLFYDTQTVSLIKYNLLKRSAPPEEAEAFFREHLHWPNFRIIAIEEALSQHDYAEAEALALEGEEVNKSQTWIVLDWKKCRLQIYEVTQNFDKQKVILKELALDENFEYYLKLKNVYKSHPEEWTAVYQDIIQQITVKYNDMHYSNSFLMQIYVEENLPDALLAEVKKSPSDITNYYQYLIKKFPAEVYHLYDLYITEKLRHADKRSHYMDICQIIRELVEIGGIDTAQRIKTNIQINYKNRPAFMDELRKIKVESLKPA